MSECNALSCTCEGCVNKDKRIAELESQLRAYDVNLGLSMKRVDELQSQLDAICDGFVKGNATNTYINIAGLIRQAIKEDK